MTLKHHLEFLGHSKVKRETMGDPFACFSPETTALISGLGDSPESVALKAEILLSANQLKRGTSPTHVEGVNQEWASGFFFFIRKRVLATFPLGMKCSAASFVYDALEMFHQVTSLFYNSMLISKGEGFKT